MTKVLITSPSLNAEVNIGGISSLTKLLIEKNHKIQYIHFVRGKKDAEKKGIYWLIRQPLVILNYLGILISSKKLKLVHINMPLEKHAIIRDSFLILLSSLLGKKILVHFHGGNYSLKHKTPWLLKILIYMSIKLSEKVITLGEKEKEFLINNFKINSDQIIALPNSVNIPEIQGQKLHEKPVVILYMGRIEKAKGLNEMISALELLKLEMNFTFYIAGDGPDKNYFLNECKNRISGKYEYLGIITGELKEKILLKSHIFLLVSYYEGLPYALLEAMANKMIPIVTPVGSIPEIIIDGKNGFLVPANDFKTLCACILKLSANSQQMNEISENAYNTAKLKFSLDNYINKINLLYEDTLAEQF